MHHMPCLHCKKSNARASNLLFQSTSEFGMSHELWSRRGGVTPHHTAPMPRWSDRRQHFGHRLISRKLTLRCGVVASLARPIPIGTSSLGLSSLGTVPAPKRSSNLLKRLRKIFAMPVRPRSVTEIRYNIIFPP